jgi:hypothetical protein
VIQEGDERAGGLGKATVERAGLAGLGLEDAC